MDNHKWLLLPTAFLAILLTYVTSASPTRAQQNPTPMAVTLTPPGGEPTVLPSPTSEFPPDRFEPNDEPGTATPIGRGTETGLTLVGPDSDYFTSYLKAGQMARLDTAVYGNLDTRLKVFDGGRLLAENDDRSPADPGSTLVFTASADGWYMVLVEKVTIYNGLYDLELRLVEPTATATAAPTQTPTITPSFTPVPFPTRAAPVLPSSPARPVRPPDMAPAATETMAATATVTTTGHVTLTLTYLGRVETPSPAPATTVRLLVYYDANNDRSPGPGEGVSSVSVLAVDAQGQRIARVFTNAQGEAFFRLNNDAVTRVIVPFVPGWSARVRVREVNEGIVLGLPAVRLPVFLPVADQPGGGEK